MKRLNTKRIFKAFFIIIIFILIYIFFISIANIFVITPIINYLADVETARIFVSCILAWFALSTLFNLVFERKN